MSQYTIYLIAAAVIYLISYFYYVKFSHGLGNRATYLQLRRFIPCGLAAVLPVALAQMPLTSPLFVIPAIIWVLWIFTYPTLYWYSNHKVSSDFEFHFEAVFGMYFIAWVSGIGLLSTVLPAAKWPAIVVLTVAEFIMFAIPVAQLIYFAMYRACINENGMQMIQETHYNEIIEFAKSVPFIYNIVSVVLVVGSILGFGYANMMALSQPVALDTISMGVIAALVIFLCDYLWKKGRGVFVRTAIVEFYLDVKEYMENNKQYTSNMQERVSTLEVEALGKPFDKPSTIFLVIGESASRDYMKAINEDYKYDSTPWLSEMKKDDHFIIYPNAYSCMANTIIAVSNAMTEINQYNDKKFYEACSVVDIARKLGYKIHWYSNQGHLGCADTAVSLIAESADVAKWTRQKLNTVQYDESLLEFLDEVDPTKNNLVVLHLKGSHFNYLNRYPAEFTKFGTPGKYELEPNYANAIAYTDSVLQKFYEYGKDKLNMQAMVYFSDHGTLADKRRSPNFEGMGTVRIPFFTYFSDEYIAKHGHVYEALKAHQNDYWTNDLAYELMCSVFDIKSNHFDEENSLASSKFKYKKEDLLTNNGEVHII